MVVPVSSLQACRRRWPLAGREVKALRCSTSAQLLGLRTVLPSPVGPTPTGLTLRCQPSCRAMPPVSLSQWGRVAKVIRRTKAACRSTLIREPVLSKVAAGDIRSPPRWEFPSTLRQLSLSRWPGSFSGFDAVVAATPAQAARQAGRAAAAEGETDTPFRASSRQCFGFVLASKSTR